MWKILIFVAAALLLYKLITNECQQTIKDKKNKKENLIVTGEMIQDPICGSFISVDSDIRVRNDYNVIYFCSYDCRDKYLKQTDTYTASSEKYIKN